ncbi:MAG: DUF5700 domain-containing putative Zn-dependent protease [Acidobacteriota bacterium]
MIRGKSLSILVPVFIFLAHSAAFPHELAAPLSNESLVDVRVVTDEADAALLAKKKAGQPITEADWQRLFSSEGYVRLKKREAAMQRAFEESEFKSFILSDKLADRAPALQETLDKWKLADTTEAGRRALAYLPAGARIRANIYPMIKPRENSFVFEVSTDPAIFLYLDPEVTKEQFENTLAHELHHIGYGGTCPLKQTEKEISKLPDQTQRVLHWIGAFGEGFAMLAAAGAPDVHPHAASKPEDRARWDRDVANFNADLKMVERFFSDVLAGRLSKEEQEKAGFSFFGVQGPWYTVGWKRAVTVEQTYGRDRLIDCMCDQRKLLPTFNRAVSKQPGALSVWQPAIIRAVTAKPKTKRP